MIKNWRKKYSTNKIKSRNFLTNTSYNSLKKNDYENVSFIIDSFSFILLNFNSFTLERNFIKKDEKLFINLLWKKCILHDLLEFTKQKENFMKINSLTLRYIAANEIIKRFIVIDPTNIQVLKHYFKTNPSKHQYVYAILFPKYFCRIDEYGLKCKAEFDCLLNEKINQFLILLFHFLKQFKKMLKL